MEIILTIRNVDGTFRQVYTECVPATAAAAAKAVVDLLTKPPFEEPNGGDEVIAFEWRSGK